MIAIVTKKRFRANSHTAQNIVEGEHPTRYVYDMVFVAADVDRQSDWYQNTILPRLTLDASVFVGNVD